MTRLTNTKHNSPTSIVSKAVYGLLRIFLGLSIYAFGVYLTIYANIGLAPWDCLAVGISRHIPLSYGGTMAAISLTAILIQLLLHERIGIATVFDAVITGNLTQLICDMSPYPENHSILLGIGYMFIGFLFIAFGMYVYMKAELGCGPKDGLFIAIGKKLPKLSVGAVGIMLSTIVTLFGWLLGGDIGIGTVFFTFGAGTIMHLFYSAIGFDPRKLQHKSLTETVKLLSGKYPF